MKKGIITICLLVAFLMVFASMAMAEEQSDTRPVNTVIVKAGVMIPTDKVTVTGQTDPLLGVAGFTVEGEYVLYSTDYIDFSGVFGYYQTPINSPVPITAAYNIDNLNSIYYMGGVKVYPTKKGFYICGYVGGGTTWVKGTIAKYGTTTTIDNSYSGVAYKAGVGYDITRNFVVEATYLVQDSEDLARDLNSAGVKRFENHGGIQIMGGYKF